MPPRFLPPGIDDTPDGVLITKFNILRKMLCDLYPGKTIQLQQANIMFDMSIPDKGTMLAESLWTKRYFMGWQISKLQMLYSMDDLLSLPIEKISALDSMVTKDTVRLFFSRRIPFNCVRTRNVPGKGEMWKLHELKQKHVSIIKDVYGVEMSVTDYLQVCIYNYMIERGKQGRHTITLATSMLEDICGSNTSMRSSFYPAMKILLDSYCDVVEDEVDDDIVYLRDHYAADAYICEALKTLFENDRSVARKREMGILYDAVCRGRATKTAPMCDEQMDAMKKHVSFPFLYVGGTGGSGKTRFLEHVAALHSGWGKVYAMSFMASVADVLYERLGETATVSTCHSFLCEHMGKCPSVSQVAARLGGKCPIERVEVLLVDEFSTMYTMLFSVVLATFMQCSSLKRVVVTGDHRQLPSIMEGNILKDFVKGLGWAFVDFRHNHRVKDPAFALIRNNADAIANGRFFDMRFDSKVVTLVSPQSDSKQGYQECLRSKLVERNYGQYEFHSVSRTNEMKGALTEVLEPHYLNKPTRWSAIYVGSKFIIRKNSKDLRLINNRILVLTDVWDQRKVSGGSMPLCGFENDFNIPSKNQGRYSNPGSVWRDSTETPVQSGYVRYIAFVSLEKMDSARQVLLLTSKLNRRLVKASATTNHCFQGKEIDHFAFVSKIYHCSFDTREGLYTASTRPKKSMLYISSKEALRKMCENPEPDRDTGLAAMLERTLSPYREGVFEQMRALDKLYTPGKGVVEAFISGEGDTGTTQTPTHTTGFCDKSTPGGQSDHGCKRKDTLQANDDVHAPTKTPKLSQDSRPDNTEAQSAPNPPRISIAKRNPPTIIKYNTVPRQGTESVTAVPMSQEKLALSPEPSLVNETKGANSTPKPSAPKRDTKVNAGQPKKTATATITTTATSKQNTSTTRAVKK